MPDDDATERGRQHGRHVEISDALGKRHAKRRGVIRMLQDQGALQIAATVQP